jgi:hypothetical protein
VVVIVRALISENCCAIGLGTVIIVICDGRDIAHISLLPKLLRQPFADSFIDDGAMNVVVVRKSYVLYCSINSSGESLYLRMNALLYFYFFFLMLL